MNRTANSIIAFAAAFACCAGAAPALFDIEAYGQIVPVDFAVAENRTYLVLDRRPHEVPRRFELEVRDSAGERVATAVLWNMKDPGWPMPRTVKLLADGDGSDVFLSGADTWMVRMGTDGIMGRASIAVAGNWGFLHGLARGRGGTVAVFTRGVVLLDGGLSETAHWNANRVVGGFAVEGDSLWVVEFGDTSDGVFLRGLSMDNLVEFEAIPLPTDISLPKVLAWPDEVLVFAASRAGWMRCSFRTDAAAAQCSSFSPDTPATPLRFGTMSAQAFRTGDDGYVLALPKGCGIWARRYSRDHVPAATQPVDGQDGSATVIFRDFGGELYGAGIRADLARGGPRRPATRIEFRRYPLAPQEPAPQPSWAAACPAWNDVSFFARATVEQVLICIKAGVNPNAASTCGKGMTPLALASLMSDTPNVVEVLLAAGADPNTKLPYGSTILHEAAARSRHAEVVSMLIGAGADVDAQDDLGMTPLHRAAQSTRDPVVLEMLVGSGANTGIRDLDGRLPLDYIRANTRLRDAGAMLEPVELER